MVWNESYYSKFNQACSYLKQTLGLIQLDYWKERKILVPYYYYIVSYLNERLGNLGTDDIKSLIEEVFTIFEWGGDLIIEHRFIELAAHIGMLNDIYGRYVPDVERESGEIDNDEDILPDVEIIDLVDGEEFYYIDCYMDRFIFCWSDFMSTLCLRLKFQYAFLFAQEPDGECCKCGAHGQTETDYESWESGVYPEDECYDRTNYYRSNTAWGLQKDRFCDCYQHPENG